jgi:hypothetical protein
LKPRLGTTVFFAVIGIITDTNFTLMAFGVVAQTVVGISAGFLATRLLTLDVAFRTTGLLLTLDVAFLTTGFLATRFFAAARTVLGAVR